MKHVFVAAWFSPSLVYQRHRYEQCILEVDKHNKANLIIYKIYCKIHSNRGRTYALFNKKLTKAIFNYLILLMVQNNSLRCICKSYKIDTYVVHDTLIIVW